MSEIRMLVLDRDTARAYFDKKFEIAFYQNNLEIARGNNPELLIHFENSDLEFKIVFNDYFIHHRKQVGLFLVSFYTSLAFAGISFLWWGIYLLYIVKTLQTTLVFLPVGVLMILVSLLTGIIAQKTLKEIHRLFNHSR